MSPRPYQPPDAPPPLRPLAAPLRPSPADAYLGRLVSPRSRRVQWSSLRQLARILSGQPEPDLVPWSAIDEPTARALRGWLGAHYANATANRMLSALRGTLHAAWKLRQMSREAYDDAADLQAFKLGRGTAGRRLAPAELRDLFLACDDGTARGARDAALLALLYGCGLRIGEAVAVQVEDLGADWLRVQEGKGGVPRIAFANVATVAALAGWMRWRGDQPGPLLCPIGPSGDPLPRPITTQAAGYALSKLAREAGVARFVPHDLRRTAITTLLEHGADYGVAAAFAGHRSVAVTQLYDRRGDAQQRAAVALLPVPYQETKTDGPPHLPHL